MTHQKKEKIVLTIMLTITIITITSCIILIIKTPKTNIQNAKAKMDNRQRIR